MPIPPGEEFYSSLGGVEKSAISRNFYVPPGVELKFFPEKSINKLDKNITFFNRRAGKNKILTSSDG